MRWPPPNNSPSTQESTLKCEQFDIHERFFPKALLVQKWPGNKVHCTTQLPPGWVIPERQLCILGLVKLQASESLEMYLLEWRHSVVKNIGGTEKLAGQVLEATVVSRRRCWLSSLSPSSRVSPHSQDLTTWMLWGRIVVWSCKDKLPK